MPQAVLAALYLPGAPCPNLASSRARWARVLDVARASAPDLASLTSRFRACGLWDEAALLAPCFDWGLENVLIGAVLTAASPDYPIAWRGRLGAAAPPALWRSESVLPSAPSLTVVGSRQPVAAAEVFLSRLGLACAAASVSVVSGGARGVDSLSAAAGSSAGGSVIEILPCGLTAGPRSGFGLASGSVRLSGSAPGAGFSVSAAKERNALLYAFGGPTIVVQPRLGTGGSWTGAVDALRRRLGVIVVWAPTEGLDADTVAANYALARLGAHSFDYDPADGEQGVAERLKTVMQLRPLPSQPPLFGHGAVREAVSPNELDHSLAATLRPPR